MLKIKLQKMKQIENTLPELSHLQFAVLEVLGTAQMSGKDLRTGLGELGIKKSGPAFYQMMARLEEAKFVEGWYIQEVVDGQIIKERQYKITGSGVRALNQTKSFYHGRTRVMALRPVFT
jgi:DNA-binding PadR family transcriptional regulator